MINLGPLDPYTPDTITVNADRRYYTGTLNGGRIFVKEWTRAQVCREYSILCRVTPHEGIVHPIGYVVQARRAMLVMEYIEGTPIERWPDGRSVPNMRVIRSGLEAAVRWIHQAGYCHGDIHESNILITPELVPVLIDFEKSRRIKSTNESDLDFAGIDYAMGVLSRRARCESA